jgi:hypothetical protein
MFSNIISSPSPGQWRPAGKPTMVIPDLTKEKYDLIGAMLHGAKRQTVPILPD